VNARALPLPRQCAVKVDDRHSERCRAPITLVVPERLTDRLLAAFEPGAVISLYEAEMCLRDAHQEAVPALRSLTMAGELRRLAEGLWVRTGGSPNPYLLGARLMFPYAFAYGTALALHAGARPVGSEILVAGPVACGPVEYDGLTYRHVDPWPDGAITRVPTAAPASRRDVAFGGLRKPETVIATTVERTLVDCVSRPDQAGGFEGLIALVSRLPVLDVAELHCCLACSRATDIREWTRVVLVQSGLCEAQPRLRWAVESREVRIIRSRSWG
jgi:predicted transcriptional regulator of viral defense system